ncbi:MAG: ATP-binding cassette domain-containing protein, partial [Syntrophobacteraceae bacterium]
MLEVDDLSLSFPSKAGEMSLFRGLSFSCKPGSLVGVTGESGSGKTGLLMALGGYLPQWAPACRLSGTIALFGRPVTQGKARNETAIVIENPYNQNTGFKTRVFEELMVPLEMRAIPRDIMAASANCLARRLGLSHILHSELDSLSGGELQRVHIGSALMARPDLLLLDQILTELDPAFNQTIFKILRTYAKDRKAIVLISSNPGEVEFHRFDSIVHLSSLCDSGSKSFSSATGSLKKTEVKSAERLRVLKIRDLHFRYSSDRPWLFDGFNLDVFQGEGCLILGPNGSGKSTLGKLLLGLIKPGSGTIEVSASKAGARNALNCSFQNPDLYFCKSTVHEELEFGTDKELAGKLADLLDLSYHYDRNPYDLPRGMRKRLSFAIAASCRPAVLFLDEPSQYQDAGAVDTLIKAMRLIMEQKTALLCCTHDRRIIDDVADFSRISLGSGYPGMSQTPSRESRKNGSPSPGLYGDKSDLGDTRTWFRKIWFEAIDSWIDLERNTEAKNFLELLIKGTRGAFRVDEASRILDIGCGEGKGLLAARKWLDASGLSKVPVLGIDVQPAFIDHARWQSLGLTNIAFETADGIDRGLLGKICQKALGGKATVAACIYVLHEEPELFALLKAISANIEDKGYLVCVLVDPQWSEALAAKGFVKVVQKAGQSGEGRHGPSTPDWRRLGLYPITQSRGRTLYLPHVLRTLEDYEKAIVGCGFTILSSSAIAAKETET